MQPGAMDAILQQTALDADGRKHGMDALVRGAPTAVAFVRHFG